MSNFLSALLIGASIVTFSIDGLLMNNNYFGFTEYRYIILLIIFPMTFLSIKKFNTRKENNHVINHNISRWKLENMTRYEYLSILVVMAYFIPMPFLSEHMLQVQIAKGILCMYIFIWLSKKSYIQKQLKNNN
ncbi:hypothetical protein A6D98_17090 [Aliivibrio fischeri]|uniref:hypothetical protein n=1 Tax=Aliivibrio fischeri TaxID=668 RepID=UPI00080E1BD2|nr:hypothetical protein [Aliivibrio fischeri]OCH58376.1 hypothetical protein A6D98_17090 [Aliivibrio fischeri]